MIKSFLVSFILLVLPVSAISVRAIEPTDLGAGLAYLRVHALDDSAKGVAAAVRERDALVLDLRYATATAESADQLRTALNARTSQQAVFILVSPATPPALAEVLKASTVKIIFIGIKDSLPTPQVVVDQPAAADRLTYDALESGRPLADLISGKIEKQRFDETMLMKEFNGAEPPPAPLATKPADTPPPKPTDRVLQRAVHLHRALLAIKQR